MRRLRAIASRLIIPVLLAVLCTVPALISNIRARFEGCPEGCNCTAGGSEVSCSGDCPREISARVTTLHCHHTRWKTITAEKVRPYAHLEVLDLSMGTIREIEEDAFASMMDLRLLNLSSTDLKLLSRDAFSVCPRLEVLDLSHNAMVFRESGPVLSSSSLSALELSYCGLSRLPEKAFSMLPSLKELHLRGNPLLKQLPKCLLHVNANLDFIDADREIQQFVEHNDLHYCETNEDTSETYEPTVTVGRTTVPPDGVENLDESPPVSLVIGVCLIVALISSILAAIFNCIHVRFRERNTYNNPYPILINNNDNVGRLRPPNEESIGIVHDNVNNQIYDE